MLVEERGKFMHYIIDIAFTLLYSDSNTFIHTPGHWFA